jgi:hypothetical protein
MDAPIQLNHIYKIAEVLTAVNPNKASPLESFYGDYLMIYINAAHEFYKQHITTGFPIRAINGRIIGGNSDSDVVNMTILYKIKQQDLEEFIYKYIPKDHVNSMKKHTSFIAYASIHIINLFYKHNNYHYEICFMHHMRDIFEGYDSACKWIESKVSSLSAVAQK